MSSSEDILSLPSLKNKNIWVIFSITLMAVLGVSSITPAFPGMMEVFDLHGSEIGYVITVFTLPGVILTPIFGILADRYGRKRILVPALFLFGIAGTLCAFAPDYPILLILRFLQGIGAASLGSLNVTLVGDIFASKDRATVMGYNASVLSIGTASYPAIGGILAAISWRYPFALPAIGVAVGFFVLSTLRNPEPNNIQTLRTYFKGVFSSIKNGNVLILFVASIITFIILYGSYLTYYPLLIKNVYGGGAVMIGIMMSLMSASTAITSTQLGRLTKAFNESTLFKFAYIIYAISLMGIALAPSWELLIIPTLTFGIAQGINIPTIQTLLTGFAPMSHRGAFMSINGMVLRLGQTLGPIVMGIVFSAFDLDMVMYVGAVLSLLMMSLIYFIYSDEGRSQSDR